MSDIVKFTWEITFLQKKNGFTQNKLLKSFMDAAKDVREKLAAKHGLTPMSSNLIISREKAKKEKE
jgi:phage terminase small subunit